MQQIWIKLESFMQNISALHHENNCNPVSFSFTTGIIKILKNLLIYSLFVSTCNPI